MCFIDLDIRWKSTNYSLGAHISKFKSFMLPLKVLHLKIPNFQLEWNESGLYFQHILFGEHILNRRFDFLVAITEFEK